MCADLVGTGLTGRSYSDHTATHRLLIRTITAASPNDRYPAALAVYPPSDGGRVTAPLASSRPSRRRSLDRADSSHSIVTTIDCIRWKQPFPPFLQRAKKQRFRAPRGK